MKSAWLQSIVLGDDNSEIFIYTDGDSGDIWIKYGTASNVKFGKLTGLFDDMNLKQPLLKNKTIEAYAVASNDAGTDTVFNGQLDGAVGYYAVIIPDYSQFDTTKVLNTSIVGLHTDNGLTSNISLCSIVNSGSLISQVLVQSRHYQTIRIEINVIYY